MLSRFMVMLVNSETNTRSYIDMNEDGKFHIITQLVDKVPEVHRSKLAEAIDFAYLHMTGINNTIEVV